MRKATHHDELHALRGHRGTAATVAGTWRDAGLAWHHALHAWVCIQRGRWWQAEHWIGATRTQMFALASLRHGYPTSYAKGAHLLPESETVLLEATLVRVMTESESRRAFAALVAALTDELDRTAPELAIRLRPMFAELTA